MSDRERQRKFEQQATIKSSEYDRHNTTMTRQTNPIGKGQNLLPTEEKRGKVETRELILRFVSVGIGMIVYFLMMLLGKIILSSTIYASMTFFVFVLAVSVVVAYTVFKLGFKLWK